MLGKKRIQCFLLTGNSCGRMHRGRRTDMASAAFCLRRMRQAAWWTAVYHARGQTVLPALF